VKDQVNEWIEYWLIQTSQANVSLKKNLKQIQQATGCCRCCSSEKVRICCCAEEKQQLLFSGTALSN